MDRNPQPATVEGDKVPGRAMQLRATGGNVGDFTDETEHIQVRTRLLFSLFFCLVMLFII